MGALAGKGLEGLSAKPVGGGEWINEKFGMPASKDAFQQGTEAALSMLSPGGVAKAIIVPAFAVKKLGDVRKAEKLIAANKPEEAWAQHGIYKDPADNIIKTVIPDTAVTLNPTAKSSGKLEVSSASFPGLPDRYAPAYGPHWSRPVVGTVQDFIQHPELFKLAPELANAPIRRQAFGTGTASYNPTTNTFELGTQRGEQEFISTLLHELQHGLAHKYSMSPGGNPGTYYASSTTIPQARKKLEKAEESLTYSGIADNAVLNSMRGVIAKYKEELAGADTQASRNYNRLPGESESRIVEAMYRQPELRNMSPLTLMNEELLRRYGGPVTRGDTPSTATKVDETPGVKAIIDNVDILYDVVLKGWAKP
jgi:hypothetical protein